MYVHTLSAVEHEKMTTQRACKLLPIPTAHNKVHGMDGI
jgi:hypothetical protein